MGDVLTGKVPGVHDAEVQIERPDGSRVTVIVNIAPLLDQRGAITGAINCFYNVTERKQAERALIHLAAIVGSSDDAIISKDLNGTITSWNRGAERLFGYTAQEAIGQPVTILIPADRRNEESGILKHIRHGETVDHYETIRCRKDGTPLDISLTVSPIIDAHGQIVGASKIARNITDRVLAEAQLRQLNDELEARVAERTEELTESQTRLRALSAELNLTEQRERQRLAMDLHDYLGQLLSVSRMKLDQAKQQPLSPQVAKLIADLHEATNKSLAYTRTLISQLSPPVLPEFGLPMALHWLTEQMQQHSLSVAVHVKTKMPTVSEEHELLLFQSIRELLLNCVKHANTYEATVTLEEVDGSLRIQVADHGAGFDALALAGKKKSAPAQGFGLFSIRERMLSLGGRFELDSSPGHGTTATLVLPLEAKGQATNHAHAPNVTTAQSLNAVQGSTSTTKPKVRVLVADDHALVRQGFCSLLNQYGDIQVVGEATTGTEAVALADRLEPDVILMDITMPKLDGVEATRRLKRKHPGTVVIGLTIHTVGQVKAAMTEAGAVAVINKEAAVDELYQTIQTTVRQLRPIP